MKQDTTISEIIFITHIKKGIAIYGYWCNDAAYYATGEALKVGLNLDNDADRLAYDNAVKFVLETIN